MSVTSVTSGGVTSMSKKKRTRVKSALMGELTLLPRSAGQTTESAYRRSLEASPTFKLELPPAKKGKKKKQ